MVHRTEVRLDFRSMLAEALVYVFRGIWNSRFIFVVDKVSAEKRDVEYDDNLADIENELSF